MSQSSRKKNEQRGRVRLNIRFMMFLITNFATLILTSTVVSGGRLEIFVVVNILFLIITIIERKEKACFTEKIAIESRFLVLDKEVIRQVSTPEESKTLELLVEKIRMYEGDKTYRVNEESNG